MKLFHLTHIKNLSNILKYGILPTYIKNEDHWEYFHVLGLKERKCIYFWDSEHYNNGKFIKDMIYCKLFIHPRNDMFEKRYDQIITQSLDINDDNVYIDFKKQGNKIYGVNGIYAILEIDSKFNSFFNAIHVQTPSDNNYSTTCIMDEKYSHEDKEIFVTDQRIDINNIKVVEYVTTRIYKNNDIGFSFKLNN